MPGRPDLEAAYRKPAASNLPLRARAAGEAFRGTDTPLPKPGGGARPAYGTGYGPRGGSLGGGGSLSGQWLRPGSQAAQLGASAPSVAAGGGGTGLLAAAGGATKGAAGAATKMGGGALKRIGPVQAAVTAGGVAVGLASGAPAGRVLGGAAGSIGGGVAGAKAGALAGGAVGSVIPGAGTAVGAAVGAFVGGLGGSIAGQLGGEALGGLLDPSIAPSYLGPQSVPPGYTAPGAPPFRGGQSPVSYEVTTNRLFFNGATDLFTTFALGPIRGVFAVTGPDGLERYFLFAGGGDTFLGFKARDAYLDIRIASLKRVDNQPDTGGDPLGEPEKIPAAAPARGPQRLGNPGRAGAPSAVGVGAPAAAGVGAPAAAGVGAPAIAPPRIAPGTNPAQPEGENEDKPAPFGLPGLGGLPRPIPAIGRAPGANPANTADPRGETQPKKAPGSKPQTRPGSCNSRCSAGLTNLTTINNNNNQTIINNLGIGTEAVNLGLLSVINTKLGPQIPDGGISTFLGKFQDLVKKAWEFTKVDKALNALNTLLLLHNVAMLSKNVGSSLGELASQALTVFGVKDAEGQPIDVNQIVGGSITQIAKNVLGEQLFNGVTTNWAKASAIISSASQIIWTIRSMVDSAREIGEWTAENVGKIGNALKKWRVVGENAYKWMPEKVQGQGRWEQRIRRAQQGLESLDDAASSVGTVLGEIGNIQSEFGELSERRQKFAQDIAQATPQERPDNEPTKLAAEASNASSAGKDAAPADRRRGDEI